MPHRDLEKRKEYHQRYYLKYQGKFLLYAKMQRLLNPERKKEKDKQYRKKNLQKIKENQRKYYSLNKEKIYNNVQKWKKNNHERVRIYFNQYEKNRKKTDINFKLAKVLRNRIRTALKGFSKDIATLKLLGCSIEELRIHLESQFQDGMTWKNHGEWHIDHKKPLSIFDLTDNKQLLEVCNFNNLQPMWARDNLIKGNKIIS